MNQYMLQQPYTTTLSLLRKIDLIRLSVELKLPTDGNVMNLRDRLRVYLNAHSETLWRNPRFRPLYPQHRRTTQPAVQQPPEPVNHTPSPTLSTSSDSSAVSYESWNGIEDAAAHHPQPQQPPQAPVQPAPLNQHAHDFYPPPPPPPPPSPSPSIPASDPGFPPPSDHQDGPRKFFPSSHSFIPRTPFLAASFYSIVSTSVYPPFPPLPTPPPLLPMI